MLFSGNSIAQDLGDNIEENQFDLATHMVDFYKIYAYDDFNPKYTRVKNQITNFDNTKQDLEIRTIIDYVDYCNEQDQDTKKYCYTILSKSGQYDALRGIAEIYYTKAAESNDNFNEQLKYLIFSAKQFGIAEGLRNVELSEDAPYRSYRMAFEDLKESELLDNYDNSKFVDDFYTLGVYESVDFPITTLLSQHSDYIITIDELNLDLDIDEETIDLIESENFIDIFNELRDLINTEEGVNYLIKKASNENYEDIFASLLRGDNGFPEEINISVYALYDQGINKGNAKAVYYLIQDFYRKHTLERDEDDYNGYYMDNVLLLSAYLKNLDPQYDNEIFNLLLSNSNDYLQFIQNFNRLKKKTIGDN